MKSKKSQEKTKTKKKTKEKSQEFLFDPKKIPKDSGCYLFTDKDKKIIYVGKAKNLRSRVSSYFQKTKKSPKTASLVKKIRAIETRTVNSEMEALILENNLIKEHLPKYNILLRDDKNFLYLRITKENLPKMEITRRLVRDGSTYIGPRTSAKSFRNTIAFCQKFFGVKMVNPAHDNYVSKMKGIEVSDDEYRENIKRMIRFLRGNTSEIVKELQQKMMDQAAAKNFEAAAKTRDLIQSIGGAAQRQTVELPDDTARDFVHFVREGGKAFFVRLVFRDGKFLNQNEVLLKAEDFHEDKEILRNFLIQFYPYVDELPSEIILPIELEDAEDIAKLLKEKSSEKISKLVIKHAQKGDKAKVLKIAQKNAKNMAEKHKVESMSQAETFLQALPDLTKRLGFENAPERIECFDISHFAGQETVASQVVFVNGEKKSSEYRRYKIQSLAPGEIDDFKSMEEVIERRFKRNPSIPLSGEDAEEREKRKFIPYEKPLTALARKNRKNATKTEILMKEMLIKNFPDKFHFQKPLHTFIADFYCPQLMLVIEVDGEYHETQKEYDELRTSSLESFGIEVVRFKNTEIEKKPKAVLKKLLKSINDRKQSLFPPDKGARGLPDLIVIDGGKGQLSSVLSVFEKIPGILPKGFNPQTQIIALAKREEEVFRGNDFELLDIPINSPASKLLQRIRDEAHRFAITYNKNLRKKSLTKSILDEIPGIGGTTKKKLLQTFGSVSGVRKATDEQLLEIVNKKQLENLRKNI